MDKTRRTSFALKKCEMNHICENVQQDAVFEKAFTSCASALKMHETKKSYEELYKCLLCEKSFANLFSLKTHKLYHNGMKPHKCSFCEKSFTTFSFLKLHQRIHTGNKPYRCSFCKRAFQTSTQQSMHEMIHTGNHHHICVSNTSWKIKEKGVTWQVRHQPAQDQEVKDPRIHYLNTNKTDSPPP
uniref:C2H2-type domain-containing protein n=1 Tax=Eptatretus burgeri TaxID=7764 RepID=A0A8C4QMD6_EPTBU